MKTASAKAKGRALQNLIAEKLRELTGLGVDDIKPQLMGGTGMDILLSSQAQTKVPFAIEAKNQESLQIWAALKQAEDNARHLKPALIFKRNRSSVYAAIRFEDFLELLKRAYEREAKP